MVTNATSTAPPQVSLGCPGRCVAAPGGGAQRNLSTARAGHQFTDLSNLPPTVLDALAASFAMSVWAPPFKKEGRDGCECQLHGPVDF